MVLSSILYLFAFLSIAVVCVVKRGVTECLSGCHPGSTQHLCFHTPTPGRTPWPVSFVYSSLPHSSLSTSFWTVTNIHRQAGSSAEEERKIKAQWAVRHGRLTKEWKNHTGRELWYFSVFVKTNVFAITMFKQCINSYVVVVKKSHTACKQTTSYENCTEHKQ